MERLPLFKDFKPPMASIEESPSLTRDPACNLCELATKAGPRTVCLPPEGEPGGLLVVGESPGRNEDASGRPFLGDSGKVVRSLVASCWDGPVAYDYAARCFPGKGGPSVTHVDTCRGYLAKTVHDVRPTRVLAFGPMAFHALVGRSVTALSRRAYGWLVGTPPAPVFYALPPVMALRNRFIRQWLDEDVRWALRTPIPRPPPWGGAAVVVATDDDAHAAAADLRTADWVAFDVETAGRMFDTGFVLLSVAFCAVGSDSAWVWDAAAIRSPGTRAVLVDLLTDAALAKGGQNVKYDTLAIRATFGVEVAGIKLDTRLYRKILDPEADASLDVMAELVGMGGHKHEAKAAITDGLKTIRKKKTDGGPLIAGLDPEVESLLRLGADPKDYTFAFMPRGVLLRYNALDAVATARLGELLEADLCASPLRRVWDELICHAERAVEQVEAWGFAVDESTIRAFDAYLGGKIAEVKQRLDAHGLSEFNPNSTPQVADLLFNKLRLTPIKYTDTGRPSTDSESLGLLRSKHPIAGDIADWRTYQKLKGTYATGMLCHVRQDGRVHSSLHLDGARSGRLSSSEPNMQNIPSPTSAEGKMSRDCFVAPSGCFLLQADYSQLELRVAAMLSGDEVMQQIFLDGHDYHQRTAEMVSQQAWGIPPEQVIAAHRKAAKIINFRTLYGGSDYANAKEIGCSADQAQAIREAIFGRFKRLARFIQECRNGAMRTGYSWTWWDGAPFRRRSLYKIADPDDEQRSVHEHASWNTPIQGTAADYCTASVVEVVRWIKEDGVPAKLVMTVHDSIVVEVREDALAEAAHQVRRIMQGWPSKGVPLLVDIEVGRAWGSMEKMVGDSGKTARSV